MSKPPFDAGIPLLTEVMDDTPAQPDSVAQPVPTRPPAFTAPSAQLQATLQQSVAAKEAVTMASLNDEEWEQLELRLTERILRQLLGRVDAALEQHVRDGLADVLQTAVENLAEELRGGLHQNLKEMVFRAVTHEITDLQKLKK